MKDSNDIVKSLQDLSVSASEQIAQDHDNFNLSMQQVVYHLSYYRAYFSLKIINPKLNRLTSPTLIKPEAINNQEQEFVYPIHDYYNELLISKAEDGYRTNTSMCKMFFTIEKMIAILVERLKEGNISIEEEVQISFEGFLMAQRKAFESVINLENNVVVINFDPEQWGENYLETVKKLAKRGYGYPPKAPRDYYRKSYQGKTMPRSKI